MTAQSNVSNCKAPLSLVNYASSLGYDVVLDAAAFAPTSVFSLEETRADALAVSFYKMFGFPTGVGALVVKKSFLERLRRPWFAGGNVEVVQGRARFWYNIVRADFFWRLVPGVIVTRARELHEQFEVRILHAFLDP
jgi:molybdenum cofactor sulfurtransferase